MEHSTNSGLREYFQTTFEAKLLSALPEDALQQTTPATQLLVRKQQTQQLEQALEQQKEVRQERKKKLFSIGCVPHFANLSFPAANLCLYLSPSAASSGCDIKGGEEISWMRRFGGKGEKLAGQRR